ncbi:hypothetical protein AALO_G00121550 [Alosa alosa]|uniref:Uncharacterized protein n=1 Tax=Alosa alosa TaxID=278164 RepID=A0AAV6GKA9_9TELE|nr:hypothetical protein AALO_G00121550 [Alosa alosa]
MFLVNKDMDKTVRKSFSALCKPGREQFSEEEFSVDPSAVEVCHVNSSTLLNLTLEESDDEISTKKEKHWRLGPENLNETVAVEFLDTE